MNGAELLVECLEAEGVKTVFGIPGEENADMMFALADSSIEVVLCRHEQAAAFMADVTGRLTGRPGVCFATLGPGATNLLTGVASAHFDRSPVIAITGQATTERTHRESHQNVDIVSMFTPVTKSSRRIEQPESIPEIVRDAFKTALAPKPGACHFELPENIAAAGAPPDVRPLPHEPVCRSAVSSDAVALAAEAIRSARRPVVLAGNGIARTGASDALASFAHRCGIPVLSTFMAKGVMARNDPASLMTVGLQARDSALCAIEEADIVITAGFDHIEYEPRLWNGEGTPIVHIDEAAAVADRHYPVAVEVVGAPATGLDAIADALTSESSEPPFDLEQYDELRAQIAADIHHHGDDATEGLIRPQKALCDLRGVLDPRDIVLCDVGAHKMWVARQFDADVPNTCLITNGFCSMAFAFPGAIAAKLAFPDRNVVAVAGDGGFLMNVQEMETARRLNLDLCVFVWEDHEYGLIKWKQQAKHGTHTDLTFTNPRWTDLASAFGWTAAQVSDSSDLKDALAAEIARPGPSLVVIPIDYRENQLLTERLGETVCPL